MERRKKERERSRKSPFIRGGGGGEVAWRQTKIMRTFLSGKIYKIIPVLLKFKIFFPPSLPCFLSLSLPLSVLLISGSNEDSDTPLHWGKRELFP